MYRVALNAVWAYPEQFDDVILRLGGMHMPMSFIGSIGALMADCGLSEILESTFGGVTKMLSENKFPQNMRALRLLVEELMRQLFSKKELTRYGDMNSVLENISEQSRTAKLWVDCLIKPVSIMVVYVRAEREADWPLHLKSTSRQRSGKGAIRKRFPLQKPRWGKNQTNNQVLIS